MRTPHQVTLHDQAYEYHTWEMLGEEIFALSQQILESGQQFDRVIALAKGGLTFARSLNDFLVIPELSALSIEFYTGVGKTAKTPVITQSLPVSIRNENILLFDDVVDSGETMKLAMEYLQHHGVKSITTASLIYKPRSVFTPDYSARETTAWVIFPNESREHIQLLSVAWEAKGDKPAQIQEHLIQIGLPKAEVEFFGSLK